MEETRIALQSLRLSGMAEKWVSLFETRQVDRLTLADGLQLLIQAEKDTRNCNRINRLLKNAAFPYPALVEQLAKCDFIRDGHSVIITGATGTGKSYLATALGDRACRSGMTVAYFNMQRLLERLDLERLQGHAITFLDRLAKTDLLILDDFGMKKLQGQQQNDFEQLAYSQLASAKLAINRKKTFLGESKLSFLRGLRFILCWILRMKASDKVEKSVPLGIYCRISLFAFSIAPFCHEEYGSAKNTRFGFLVPFGAKAFDIIL